jgi:hypothetical protein
MYAIPNKPLDITFDWLFDRIRQEDVYVKYFGFCDLTQKHINPLRNDGKPDCTFVWHNGILFFRDFAYKKSYTCVSIVMESEKLSYKQALEKIYNLFLAKSTYVNLTKIDRPKTEKAYKDIKVTIQPFTEIDINYLKSFGITSDFCKKAKWYSIKHYWINNQFLYTYSKYNPCIGYYFEGRWKLYFYLNKEWRFLSNTTHKDIQGWKLLPESGDILVITKSFKDVGTLYEQNIPSIAPQAESVLIQEDIITNLKQRFKKIYSLMDYDNSGISMAWMMRKLYDIEPLFFTDKLWNRKGGYKGAKDISDYRKLYGYEETQKLIYGIKNR